MEANERIQKLIKNVSETLLWEIVSADVENTTHLPTMLDGIGYINHELINQITRCEIMDLISFDVIDAEAADEKIYISFSMPFILTAWDNSTQLLRISAVAEGTCSIPGINEYDWDSKDFYAMGKQELLSYRNLVEIEELCYSEVECDEPNNASK